MVIRINPYANAMPMNDDCGEEKPRAGKNMMTDIEPKKTSANVPMNSAT